jgi:hypothetical protein
MDEMIDIAVYRPEITDFLVIAHRLTKQGIEFTWAYQPKELHLNKRVAIFTFPNGADATMFALQWT